MPEINLYGQTVGDVVPDWNGAAVLPRETLIGQYCRLVPTDADSHAADLFDAYAQARTIATGLACKLSPTSVEAAVCWVQGKLLMHLWFPMPSLNSVQDELSDWCALWRLNESTVRSKLVM